MIFRTEIAKFCHNFDFWPKFLFWPKKSFFDQKCRFVSENIFFDYRNELYAIDYLRKFEKWWKLFTEKKVTFGRKCIGRVYIASRAKIVLFTHPIFESDFDCLTGKNRLHANSLLSLLASDKTKNLQKKMFLKHFFRYLKTLHVKSWEAETCSNIGIENYLK